MLCRVTRFILLIASQAALTTSVGLMLAAVNLARLAETKP
jgi:hypothetical protein